MNFSEAFAGILQAKKITREAWAPTNAFLFLRRGRTDFSKIKFVGTDELVEKENVKTIDGIPAKLYDDVPLNKGEKSNKPLLCREFVPTLSTTNIYHPTQDDLMADDWAFVL